MVFYSHPFCNLCYSIKENKGDAMRTVAYCRVSTSKDEQLDSLAAQQRFFTEYSEKNNYHLVQIYADEGKSGTKLKNRTQLLKLLADAKKQMFDIVLIKDVSRLARNTVDFLTSIRALKALGVKVVFVNYDQTDSDSSEFMLTLLSAIAQEESANTSKRVKFGKKMNAEKGRVPNIVYGYNKQVGDYFSLEINEPEAQVVRDIFDMYVNENFGANKIAMTLNAKGYKTKRGCKWTQNAIARILANQIYIGRVINGKEEVEDFLTGKRKEKNQHEWIITENEALRIIPDELFDKAQKTLAQRTQTFNITGERNSDKHVFSKLIKCSCCHSSFRQSVRTYKNTYTKWVCTGRNAKGAGFCINKTVIDEAQLLEAIKAYFVELLMQKPSFIKSKINQLNRLYQSKDENVQSEKTLMRERNRLNKLKQKQIEMYEADIISLDALKERTQELDAHLVSVDEQLHMIQMNVSKSDMFKNALMETFCDIENGLKAEHFTNAMLNRVIEKITVDENGKIDVYLRLLSDIGMENSVLLSNDQT